MTDPLITDGRAARRERNRTAVLDAVLELFGEGATNPTPDEVADRSGISLRSVYRYFDDRETLLRSAMEHHFLRVQPLFVLSLPADADLDDRVVGLVEHRMRLYEAAAPVFRMAIARAARSKLIAERVEDRRTLLARQVDETFGAELAALGSAAPAISATIDTLVEFEAVDHLRRFRGFNAAEATEALRRSIHQLLRPH